MAGAGARLRTSLPSGKPDAGAGGGACAPRGEHPPDPRAPPPRRGSHQGRDRHDDQGADHARQRDVLDRCGSPAWRWAYIWHRRTLSLQARRMAESQERSKGAQKVAGADNGIKLAVEMTVAAISSLELSGSSDEQAVQ